MFIFVILSLFSAWIWEDATEQISMGLSLVPFCHFESLEYSGLHEIVFLDMDMDGDEDMLEWLYTPDSVRLHAFENILTSTGRVWGANQRLLNGLDTSSNFVTSVSSLGAGDINGDSRDELIIVTGAIYGLTMNGYVNDGQFGEPLWVKDNSLFSNLVSDSMASEPDFADIDGDGDLDMVGLFNPESSYWPFLCLWWNKGTPQKPEWYIDTSYFDGDRWDDIENPCWIDWKSDGIWDVILTGQTGMSDPPPQPWAIGVLHNYATKTSPQWKAIIIHDRREMDAMALVDWNQDGVEDIVFPGDEFDGGYYYVPGSYPLDTTSYDFYHHNVWGGIIADYPAVADINGDKIPEITVTEQEHHMWGVSQQTHHYWSHTRTYVAENKEANQWKLFNEDYWGQKGVNGEGFLPPPPATDSTEASIQYLDFNNDGLIDYIRSSFSYIPDYVGGHALYLNVGSATQPEWKVDTAAFNDLPGLFPASFIDINGDDKMDIVGWDWVDLSLHTYMNIGTLEKPQYSKEDFYSTGLEGIHPTFVSAADLNNDTRSDLALGFRDDVVAYFNAVMAATQWERHEEVFAGIQGGGNPCLCDADGDEDLDLFIVQYDVDGRLHFYRNESTGGVDERSPARLSGVTISYIGDEVEISLTPGEPSDEAKLLLYNTVGQRVMQVSRQPHEGMVRFRILQSPGVYFYQVSAGGQNFTGKIVLY